MRHRLVSAVVAVATLLLGHLVLASPASAALVASEPDPGWGTNGKVWAIARVGDVVYVGGRFTEIRDRIPTKPNATVLPAANLAAFDARTGEPLDWRPRTGGGSNGAEVYTIAPSPDGRRIYIGGAFTKVDGLSRPYVAAVDPVTGAVDTGFRAAPNYRVRAILPLAEKVYLGGDFKFVAGQSRMKLAAVSHSGALDGTWAPRTKPTYDDGTLTAWRGRVTSLVLAPDGNRIFVAGDFTAVNGVPRRSIAAVSRATGATDLGFAPSVEPNRLAGGQHVFDLLSTPTRLYVAMGGYLNYVGAYDPATGKRTHRILCDGDVQGLALAESTLYVAGHFDVFAGVAHKRLAAVDTRTMSTIHSWTPSTNSYYGVWDIVADESRVHVGGEFTWVSGQARPYFARFTAPGAADTTAPSAPGDLRAAAPSHDRVDLSWSAATDDTGVTGYQVLRDGTALATTSGTSYTDGSVAAEQEYTYTVRARDAAGNWSVPSAPATVTTPAAPTATAPAAPTMTAGSATATSAYVDWVAEGDAAGYDVFRDGVLLASLGSAARTYTDSTAAPATDYTYGVAARGEGGQRSSTATAAVRTPSASVLFQDDLERGRLASWTGSTAGLVVQSGGAASGSYAARGTVTGGPAMARREIAGTPTEVYYRLRFKVDQLAAKKIVLARIQRSATPRTLTSLYLKPTGTLGYRNEIAGVDRNSRQVPARGVWHTALVRVVVNGADSTVQVELNGQRVPALDRTESLGTQGVDQIHLGDSAGKKTYDVRYDDVLLSTTRPAS